MKKQSKAAQYIRSFTPQIALSLKEYNKDKLLKDIVAGIIVGIIALPLSLALAIASGAPPEVGLVTAILGGGIAALLSGSRNQVSGPTAAFIPIVLSVALTCGPSGFITAVFLAGIMLCLMGFLKLGKLVNYISLPIIAGFTAGIAVSIFSGQMADFMGYESSEVPKEFLDKVYYYIEEADSVNFYSILIGVISVAIMLIMPKVSKKIPGALIAIIFAVLINLIFKPDVETIGTRFGELKLSFNLKAPDFSTFTKVIGPSVSIALLAAIESLLSAKAADNMTKTSHNPDAELLSQGVANITSSLFGGLPVTGAIARTSANIKNGGVTPVSTVIHALFILLVGILLMPLAVYIPLTSLSAVLIVVCKNMFNAKEAKKILAATRRDIILFFAALSLTVIFDLVVAIISGMIIAVAGVIYKKYKAKSEGKDSKLSVDVRNSGEITSVSIKGALNFITASKFNADLKTDSKIVIVDLKDTTDLDLQGYMVVVQIVKTMLDEGRSVKVVGNKRCIRYLFKINYSEEENLDLTDILVGQSMLTFNKNKLAEQTT